TGAPNQFSQSVTEFRADGQIIQIISGYSDGACTNALGSDAYTGKYTTTVSDIHISASINGSVINLTMSYMLNGDMLTLTPKSLTVDGNPQDVSGMGPATMKRK